eukprot:g3682.t1
MADNRSVKDIFEEAEKHEEKEEAEEILKINSQTRTKKMFPSFFDTTTTKKNVAADKDGTCTPRNSMVVWNQYAASGTSETDESRRLVFASSAAPSTMGRDDDDESILANNKTVTKHKKRGAKDMMTISITKKKLKIGENAHANVAAVMKDTQKETKTSVAENFTNKYERFNRDNVARRFVFTSPPKEKENRKRRRQSDNVVVVETTTAALRKSKNLARKISTAIDFSPKEEETTPHDSQGGCAGGGVSDGKGKENVGTLKQRAAKTPRKHLVVFPFASPVRVGDEGEEEEGGAARGKATRKEEEAKNEEKRVDEEKTDQENGSEDGGKKLWCEFDDTEGSTIRFEITPSGDLSEVCDGVVVVPKLTELVIDRSTESIFDGSETIPVQTNDLEHIVQWFNEMNVSRRVVRFKNADRDADAHESASSTPSPSSTSKGKGDSATSTSLFSSTSSGVTQGFVVASVFEECVSGEEFCVVSVQDDQIRYASLTPQNGAVNVFSCKLEELTADVVRLVRVASKKELRKARNLARIEERHQDDDKVSTSAAGTNEDITVLCKFTDADGSKIVFVANKASRTLTEYCDNEITMEHVASLRADESTNTLFDEEEEIPLQSKDVARVFAWLRDISSTVRTSIRFVGSKRTQNVKPSTSPRHDTIPPKIDSDNVLCAFVDMEGTSVELVANMSTGVLEERCDGEVAVSHIAALRVDESTKVLFDGEEDIPLQSKDVARVFAWLREIAPAVKTSIEFVESKPADTVVEPEDSTSSSKTISCKFVDTEGTSVELVANMSTGVLEERCDGEVAVAHVAALRVDESTKVLFDGEEDIPLQFKDVARVFAWLREIAPAVKTSIEFVGSKPADTVVVPEDSPSSSKTISCKFVDTEGTSVELVANMSTGVLEERCDGEVAVAHVAALRVDESTKSKDVARVFAWLREVAPAVKTSIEFVESRPADVVVVPEDNPSTASSICRFVDLDGAQIEFSVIGAKLQEICDGKLIKRSVKILTANRDGVLNDGSEDIPLRSEDQNRILTWLRDVSGRVKCQILFEEGGDKDEDRVEFEDMDGTFIAFVINDEGILEEWCDGILEIPALARVTIRPHDINDGVEEIPLKEEDQLRVRRWFEEKADDVECEIIFAADNRGTAAGVERTSAVRPISENGKRNPSADPRKCGFEDMEGTAVELVVNSDGDLEEWCDGKLEIMKVKKLVVRLPEGVLHDGEEIIPLRQVDKDRVVAWLRKIATERSVTCIIDIVDAVFDFASRNDGDACQQKTSTPSRPISSSRKSPKTYVKMDAADLKIGDRVSVYWPKEKRSFKGVVTGVKIRSTPRRTPTRRNNSVHTITYDDGDVRTYRNLNAWEWSLESSIRPATPSTRKRSIHETPKCSTRRVHPIVSTPTLTIASQAADEIEAKETTSLDSASTTSPPWSSIIEAATTSLCLAHIQQDDEIPIRGRQIDAIASFIRDHVREQKGGAMYVCGSPGTGKTIAVSRALYKVTRKQNAVTSPEATSPKNRGWRQKRPEHVQLLRLRAALEREGGGRKDGANKARKETEKPLRFELFQANAMKFHTEAQVFETMCSALRLHPGTLCSSCRACSPNGSNATSKSAKAVLKCRMLHRRGVAQLPMVAVVMDEIDGLCRGGKGRSTGPLHQLFEWASFPGSRLVLLGIANGVNVIDRFFPRLRALNSDPDVLVFEPYSAEQIENILLQRLSGTGALEKRAKLDGPILPESVIRFCAKKVATVSGDARAALDACRRALECLRCDAGVGMRDMARVLKSSFGSQASKHISNLPTEAQLLFCVIAVLQYAQRGLVASNARSVASKPVSLGALRVSFCHLRRHLQKAPVAFDALRGMLLHLTECGLAELSESSRSREKQLVRLKVPANEISGAFGENTVMFQILKEPASFLGRVQ